MPDWKEKKIKWIIKSAFLFGIMQKVDGTNVYTASKQSIFIILLFFFILMNSFFPFSFGILLLLMKMFSLLYHRRGCFEWINFESFFFSFSISMIFHYPKFTMYTYTNTNTILNVYICVFFPLVEYLLLTLSQVPYDVFLCGLTKVKFDSFIWNHEQNVKRTVIQWAITYAHIHVYIYEMINIAAEMCQKLSLSRALKVLVAGLI